MNRPHILIVDDDERILKLLGKFLEKNGYTVSAASSATEAQEYMQRFIFDLVILDVMMPKITGTELAKSIKDNKIHVPIILLTALAEIEHRIEGLSSGADDYISKPFDPQELLLRMKNLIEIYGYKKDVDTIKRFGSCTYNLKTKELVKNGQTIPLSGSEQKLLETLISAHSTPMSRAEIAQAMKLDNERSVDVQITRLRGKIEDDTKYPKFLQTVRNEGYALYI